MPSDASAALELAVRAATDEAFLAGMYTTMFLGAALALVGAFVALLIRPRRMVGEHETTIVH